MAIGVVTRESTLALTQEVTEGTYVAPSANTDYQEVLSEGLELNLTREELARNNMSSTVESDASRVGMAEVAGSIPVELRSSTTAGAVPQTGNLLLKATLGGARTAATKTTTTGATSTILTFASHSFLVGDCVMVKESGAYEIRPISAVDSTTITFPFALTNGAPSDGVVVEAVATYFHDTANAITMSAEHNIGNTIQHQVTGLRAASMSLENFTVGQIPTLNFSVQGLDSTRSDSAGSYTPSFAADALPPVALEACLWIDGTVKSYTELSMNIENEISFIKDACDADGRIASRITSQSVSLSVNPYLDDTTFAEWTAFEANTDQSVFFYAFNPSTTAGEFSNGIAVWLPQTKITTMPVADNEGIATEAIEFKAHRSSTGSDSVFISYS